MAHNEDKADEWLKANAKYIEEVFKAQREDKELNSFEKQIADLFTSIDKKSKGKFYERFDWYVERDEQDKLVLHVFEI